MPVLRKLISPAGFVLALLFFVLPFVAVSCEEPDLGSLDVSYTGLDLATGGEPSVEIDDRSGSVGDLSSEPPPEPGAQLLAIITAALAAVGVGTTAIRPARPRMLATGATAALAAVLLVVTQVVAQANLRSHVRERVARTDFPIDDLDLVHTRVGFWLALSVLAVVAVVNLAVAVRAWVRQ